MLSWAFSGYFPSRNTLKSFKTMEFSFKVDGQKVVLRGMSKGASKVVSIKRMGEIFRHGDVACAAKCSISSKSCNDSPKYYQDDIRVVLDRHTLI